MQGCAHGPRKYNDDWRAAALRARIKQHGMSKCGVSEWEQEK
jgi:hypothetical protein